MGVYILDTESFGVIKTRPFVLQKMGFKKKTRNEARLEVSKAETRAGKDQMLPEQGELADCHLRELKAKLASPWQYWQS